MSQGAARHVLRALICQLNVCTYVEAAMERHRAAALARGCSPSSPSLQPVAGSSEAAPVPLAPVQSKVSPTTFCSLSSRHCLLEQRDYSLGILLYLSKWPSQVSSPCQLFTKLSDRRQFLRQQKRMSTKYEFICQEVGRQNVQSQCAGRGKGMKVQDYV